MDYHQPQDSGPDYFTLGRSAGWAREAWQVELSARNLNDARGHQSRAGRFSINHCGPSTRTPLGQIYRIYIPPRTIGPRV